MSTSPRDRVPDRGSVMWSMVSFRRLFITAFASGCVAGALFWWSAFGQRGAVFLTAIGAIFACIAIGCLLLTVWHGGTRLRQRGRGPS